MYIDPYQNIRNGGQWLKANFHTHAGTGENTCGKYMISEVLDQYMEVGYEVICISNHDLFSSMKEYQERYDLVLIEGFEYSRHEHMLCIGCADVISSSYQMLIDSCNLQGGLVVLCHPHYMIKDYWPLEKMKKLNGYTGIEVINASIGRVKGTGWAEDVWDEILSSGKIVYGFGNDDFHRWYDLHKAWNRVYVEERCDQDVLQSLKQGRFYVSTGLELETFVFENHQIQIKAKEPNVYDHNNYEYIFIGQNGRILDRQRSIQATYTLTNEMYVRVKVIGPQGMLLLTQPVFLKEQFKEV